MKVDLSKEDLIAMVKGSSPDYKIMKWSPICRVGSFRASYGRWVWDHQKLSEMDESTLWCMRGMMR